MESDIIKSVKITNILKNIDNYNDRLLISHVIIFFQRHNIEFTKTMIQNYVRIGLIPPPLESRRYTRVHLLLLALINELKELYSLDEIKSLFDATNEIVEPEELYRLFMYLNINAVEGFNAMWNAADKERQALISKTDLKNMDSNKSAALISLLTLPTYSKIIKNIIHSLWDTI